MQPVIAARPGGHAAVNRLFTTAAALCIARVCIQRSMLPAIDPIHSRPDAALQAAAAQLLRLAVNLLQHEDALIRRMHADAVRLIVTARCPGTAHLHSELVGNCDAWVLVSNPESLCLPTQAL